MTPTEEDTMPETPPALDWTHPKDAPEGGQTATKDGVLYVVKAVSSDEWSVSVLPNARLDDSLYRRFTSTEEHAKLFAACWADEPETDDQGLDRQLRARHRYNQLTH